MRRKILPKCVVPTCLILSILAAECFAGISDQLKQAQDYQNNRQYEQAEAIYQQIVTAFPDTNDALEAQKQLTLIYIATDKQQQADAAFEKLVAGFSKHKGIAEAVWQIAKRYEEPEKYNKAFQLHQYNVKHFPGDLYAMWSQVEVVYHRILNVGLGNADAAFNDLVTIFSDQPTLPKEIFHIAAVYTNIGKADESLPLHQYNISHFPNDINDIYVLISQVDCHILQGDDAAAQAEFDKLISLFSSHPALSEGIWSIGRTYSAVRKFDSAFKVHTYNAEHFPDTELGMCSQVEIVRYHIRNANDAAADAAVDKLLAMFSKQPNLPKEIYQLAVEVNKAGKRERAIRLHQCNVAHFPIDMYAMRSQVEIVYSYIRDGNEPAADAAFNKLLTVFSSQPTLPKKVHEIADAYSIAGRDDKANQLYQYVINLPKADPKSGQSILAKAGMARLNISLGNDAAVQTDVNNLIADFKDNPDLPQAIFTVGDEYYNKTLNNKGEPNLSEAKAKEYYQKALAVWERIITELPKSESIFITHAYCLSAVCYHELGNHEKAIEYFQKVVTDWPDYEYAWSAQYLIGECYEDLQRSGILPASEGSPLMEQAYKAVIEKYPDCSLVGPACLKLGWPRFQKGQWSDAAYYFELFLQKSPSDDPLSSGVLYNLGQAYEQMGKLDLAAEIYRTFIQMSRPTDPRIKTAQALLEKLEGENK
jgi:tetratricopeptide (TPR) repeat protein